MNNDEQLVNRINAGDSGAFEQLVHAYEKKVYTMALRMTGNAEDACDLSQEVFLRIYRSLGQFKNESSLSTWIYRLSSNVCIDFLRRRKKHQEIPLVVEQEDGEREIEISDMRYNPENEYDKQELKEALAGALQCLSAEHRQIVVLRDIGGLSYSEIACVLEIEEGTVKSRLFRSREQLRRILTQGNIFTLPASKKAQKR